MSTPIPSVLVLGGLVAALASPAPAAAGIHVVGELTRSLEVVPGQRVEGEIQVRNSGDQPEEVTVYLTDYSYQADGSNHYDEPGSVARSNGSWVSFAPRRMVVDPGTSTPVSFAIDVPEDPALSGTYWSLLMVEGRGPAQGPDGGADVHLLAKVRYGTQLLTTVGEGAESSLSITGLGLVPGDEGAHVQVDVANDGEVSLHPAAWIEVFGYGGATLGRFEAVERPVLPGCSVRFDVDLSSLDPGRYPALIVVDGGEDHLLGTQQVLELR